jgi:hypothetical protein
MVASCSRKSKERMKTTRQEFSVGAIGRQRCRRVRVPGAAVSVLLGIPSNALLECILADDWSVVTCVPRVDRFPKTKFTRLDSY